MDVRGRRIVILGGSGLVGQAIARRLLPLRPARLVVGGLRRPEAEEAAEQLRRLPEAEGTEIVPEWGDLFLRESQKERSRAELVASEEGRAMLLSDMFDDLSEEVYDRSALASLLERHRPHVLIDCVNTATAIAYQSLFPSVERLRAQLTGEQVTRSDVESHLTTLYLPQLIRHVQLLMEGMRRAGTEVYLKIGTSGTGGMGLNIPFTHSEERPSATLLSKTSVAGAHSLLLFLLARTAGAPAVKEIKPTAAIAWKQLGFGVVRRGGRPIRRVDSREPVRLEEAFSGGTRDQGPDGPGTPDGEAVAGGGDDVIRSVYLDAGENGLFSLGEFEAISALGMMELVTPEEIADAAVSEILGRPTGRDVVGALDASSFGPTYRAGVLRESALRRMEELQEEHGVRSVAFEMLGPPRLSKLLFEAEILRRLCPDVAAAAELDSETTGREAARLVMEDARLRSDILSIGLPIVLPDGERLLRGPEVKVVPPAGAAPDDPRWAAQGWVDLRPAAWEAWRRRCRDFQCKVVEAPGADAGSGQDLDVRARGGEIRPGALAAFVFGGEDRGRRQKR